MKEKYTPPINIDPNQQKKITISAAESADLYGLTLKIKGKYDPAKPEYYRQVIKTLKSDEYLKSLSPADFMKWRGIIKEYLDEAMDSTGISKNAIIDEYVAGAQTEIDKEFERTIGKHPQSGTHLSERDKFDENY